MSPLVLVHAAVVGTLLGGAAIALEAVLRQRRLPARGIWAGALALTLAAPLWGPVLQRASAPGGAALSGFPAATPASGAPAELERSGVWAWLGSVGRSAGATLVRLDVVDPRIARFWGATAAATLLLVAASFARLSLRVRRLPRARVGGDEVVISSAFGPACVGLSRARVVIPRWLLAFGRTELDLVIRHERAHAEARDPLLLALGLGAVALAPWNPALWWQVVRLRRAVELDCDRRVLASGAEPGAYGRVLLSVLGRLRTPSFPAPALLEPTSFLERRLLLMRRRLPNTPHRTLGALALAGGLIALACEAPAPTSPAPAAADGEAEVPISGKLSAHEIRVVAPWDAAPGQPAIYVDGVLAPEGTLTEIDPDRIASVEVVKGEAAIAEAGQAGRRGLVKITTKAASDAEESTATIRERRQPAADLDAKRPLVQGERWEATLQTKRPATDAEAAATVESWAAGRSPLVLVDGEPLAGGVDALVALPKTGPRSIASIEIVKGAAAEAIYGPAGRDGVVRVTTRGRAGG